MGNLDEELVRKEAGAVSEGDEESMIESVLLKVKPSTHAKGKMPWRLR